MPSLALSTAVALLAAYGVSAQDVKATIWAYSTEQCAGDGFSESTSMEIFDTNTVLSGGSWNCMYSSTSLPGFELVGGQYKIFVDETTIPDDCSLVLYQGAPKGDDTSQGECQTYYSSISNKNGACIETEIAPQYGYAMCCGTNCDAAASPPPAKRMFEEEKVRDVSAPAKKIRDVAAHKRTAPLNNLSPRADCTFSGSGDSLTSFGVQQKVVSSMSCPAGADDCSETGSFDYTSSDTNTFGVSTEIGAAFEIFSASVSFSAEVSHTESKSYTKQYTVTIPQGQSGYLTFQAKYECTPKGTLSGSDCAGLPTDTEGVACYPVFVSGLPDGQYLFVQDI